MTLLHPFLVYGIQWQFGYILSVGDELLLVDAVAAGELADGLQRGLSCNLNVCLHVDVVFLIKIISICLQS